LNYTRDTCLHNRDSHHCVTGLLRTVATGMHASRDPCTSCTSSLYSALRASVATRHCSRLLPAIWSNPRLKLGKLQLYH